MILKRKDTVNTMPIYGLHATWAGRDHFIVHLYDRTSAQAALRKLPSDVDNGGQGV